MQSEMDRNTGIGQARTSAEPTLEVMQNINNTTSDVLSNIEMLLNRAEDYLSGPRPEKEANLSEACPSGMLAQMCALGQSNLDRLHRTEKRLSVVLQNIGVA